ncbi:MAG: hypothetical protein Tsb009_21730 [Planctomycetaceae bacterium]
MIAPANPELRPEDKLTRQGWLDGLIGSGIPDLESRNFTFKAKRNSGGCVMMGINKDRSRPQDEIFKFVFLMIPTNGYEKK